MSVEFINLITGIASLQQLVIFFALSTSDSLFSPRVQLLVHLLLQHNADFFLAHDVDVAEKADVLALDPGVSISVDLLALLK